MVYEKGRLEKETTEMTDLCLNSRHQRTTGLELYFKKSP